jgi:hypothetical protein
MERLAADIADLCQCDLDQAAEDPPSNMLIKLSDRRSRASDRGRARNAQPC